MGSALSQLRSAGDDFMRELTREPRELGDGEKPPKREVKAGAPSGGEGEEESPEPLTDQQIRDAASKLGIKVEGKTSEELRREMLERVLSGHADPYGLEGEVG